MDLILAGIASNQIWIAPNNHFIKAILIRLEGGKLVATNSLPYMLKGIYIKPLEIINNELVFLNNSFIINHQLSYLDMPVNCRGVSIDIPNGFNFKVDLSVETMALYPISLNVNSTAFTSTTVNLTNTATKVLTANADRKGFTIYNAGTKTCYLDYTNTVSSTSKAFDLAAGYLYSDDVDWAGDVWMVASSGTQSITIREFT